MKKSKLQQRDGGGPVVNKNGVQFGIIPIAPAWKGVYCLSDTTNQFINIFPFLDWINQKTASAN